MASEDDDLGFNDDDFEDNINDINRNEDETYEDDTESSNIGVIKIGKENFAIKLIWEKANQPNKSLEAKELAKRNDSDFYCIKKTGSPQYGFGTHALGHNIGMPSLAAYLSGIDQGSWIGLFSFSEGYYIIAIKEDNILSEFDALYTSRNTAIEKFEELKTQSDWHKIYVSENLKGITKSQVFDIDSYFKSKKAKTKLISISVKGSITKILALLFLGGASILGIYIYKNEQISASIESTVNQNIQNIVPKKEPEIQVPNKPWIGKHNGAIALIKCSEEITAFPLDVPSWKTKSMSCEDINGKATLTRGLISEEGGQVSILENYINKNDKENNKQMIWPTKGSESNVDVVWSLRGNEVPIIPADIKTLDLTYLKKVMIKYFESQRIPIAFSEESDTTNFYKQTRITFTTEKNPKDFYNLFINIPTFVLNDATYTVDTRKWTISGTLYHWYYIPKINETPQPQQIQTNDQNKLN